MKSEKHIFALFYKNLSTLTLGQSFPVLDKELCTRIIKVLRLQIDDKLILFSDQLNVLGQIKHIGSTKVECIALSFEQNQSQTPELFLAVGQVKNSVFEEIVYQAACQGVSGVFQIQTAKSEPSAKPNLERLSKIMISAQEQAKSFTPTKILPTVNLEDIHKAIDLENTQTLLLDPSGSIITDYKTSSKSPILLIIGSGAGLQKEEVDFLIKNGAKKATLGKSILKTEMACTVATGLIRALF